jgi:LL-diaminopimelate aminotransferase
VVSALHEAVEAQGEAASYTGYGASYGAEHGTAALRVAIAQHYERYGVSIDPNDVFVSDGAKPDSTNIQSIFAPESIVAVQDPTYPIYVDAAVIAGKTTGFKDGRYEGIVYMDSTGDNGFFPEVPDEKVDLIYLCNPNNPTGTAATRDQLKTFVDYAQENGAVIIYDAAYSAFVSDDDLPRSIYEIEGAENCAIEINSFSKIAGFTGTRLSWTVVPEQLVAGGSKPGEVRRLWSKRQVTMFNGVSNIVQAGGLAVLSEQGLAESQRNVDYYMRNATMIRDGLHRMGIRVFGGEHAPYVWAESPDGMGSWSFFDRLLKEAHVVTTPGSGYGRQGEGFVRLSAFGSQQRTAEAVQSIEENLRLIDREA